MKYVESVSVLYWKTLENFDRLLNSLEILNLKVVNDSEKPQKTLK